MRAEAVDKIAARVQCSPSTNEIRGKLQVGVLSRNASRELNQILDIQLRPYVRTYIPPIAQSWLTVQ